MVGKKRSRKSTKSEDLERDLIISLIKHRWNWRATLNDKIMKPYNLTRSEAKERIPEEYETFNLSLQENLDSTNCDNLEENLAHYYYYPFFKNIGTNLFEHACNVGNVKAIKLILQAEKKPSLYNAFEKLRDAITNGQVAVFEQILRCCFKWEGYRTHSLVTLVKNHLTYSEECQEFFEILLKLPIPNKNEFLMELLVEQPIDFLENNKSVFFNSEISQKATNNFFLDSVSNFARLQYFLNQEFINYYEEDELTLDPLYVGFNVKGFSENAFSKTCRLNLEPQFRLLLDSGLFSSCSSAINGIFQICRNSNSTRLLQEILNRMPIPPNLEAMTPKESRIMHNAFQFVCVRRDIDLYHMLQPHRKLFNITDVEALECAVRYEILEDKIPELLMELITLVPSEDVMKILEEHLKRTNTAYEAFKNPQFITYLIDNGIIEPFPELLQKFIPKGSAQTILCLLNNPKVHVNCVDGETGFSPYMTLLFNCPISMDDKKYIIETALENPRITEETLNFVDGKTLFQMACEYHTEVAEILMKDPRIKVDAPVPPAFPGDPTTLLTHLLVHITKPYCTQKIEDFDFLLKDERIVIPKSYIKAAITKKSVSTIALAMLRGYEMPCRIPKKLNEQVEEELFKIRPPSRQKSARSVI